MIFKNRVFIIALLAILSLNSCGDRAEKTVSTPVVNIVDNDGDGSPSNIDPDDNDPCVPSRLAGTCDQDNDGLTNDQENLTFRTDPLNPDTDGDGLLDGTGEALSSATSNPLDSCDPAQSAGYRGYNNSNALWKDADCDGDGYKNGTEDNISLTPNNYISDPYDASSSCFTVGTVVYCAINTQDGRTWLDRNLGASKVCESATDANCYGNLYQWGRGADGHHNRGSIARDDNPDTFPYSSLFHEISTTGQFDWLSITGGDEASSGFIVERQSSWTSVTNNSICPVDWYVPTYTEINDLATAEGITNSATAFASALRLPLAGSKSSASSSLSLEGKKGYIWTTDTDFSTNISKAFTYTSTGILQSDAYRASGYSVRCIKKP